MRERERVMRVVVRRTNVLGMIVEYIYINYK